MCGLLGTGGLTTYLHESGHRFATNLVYKRCAIEIKIESWLLGGGTIEYDYEDTKANLTSFGKLLGRDYAVAFRAIAGPITDLAVGVLLLEVAENRQSPFLASCAKATALTNLSHVAYYAFKDICLQCEPNGDFTRFSKHTGIAPIVTFGVSLIASGYFLSNTDWFSV
jgi:hypothetical protein